jgi:hypothetical protein
MEDTPDIPWTELATDVQLVTELVTGGYFTQVIAVSRSGRREIVGVVSRLTTASAHTCHSLH